MTHRLPKRQQDRKKGTEQNEARKERQILKREKHIEATHQTRTKQTEA